MAASDNTSPKVHAMPPLAQHRRRSGISLRDISEKTKINLRFLRAIENEEFSSLPGGIFARSYIRQYAAAISFDEDELLGRYHAQTGEPKTTPSDLFPKPPAKARSGRRGGLSWFRSLSAIRFP